ncbi:hypothetical protein SAMN05421688_0882 [Poseidonocella pacifica]|uniref:Uncharacterized protein n=1 Tax=Poseidonocella pacifica TaxID=871651 RepID=A0A1I0VRW2_9RHOB|nr:hypothetical protein [Poseidonocella pacifica]SFA78670.1 hypothetical protein SAMN05421688_0882 [Poseidonocella pacifica]
MNKLTLLAAHVFLLASTANAENLGFTVGFGVGGDKDMLWIENLAENASIKHFKLFVGSPDYEVQLSDRNNSRSGGFTIKPASANSVVEVDFEDFKPLATMSTTGIAYLTFDFNQSGEPTKEVDYRTILKNGGYAEVTFAVGEGQETLKVDFQGLGFVEEAQNVFAAKESINCTC